MRARALAAGITKKTLLLFIVGDILGGGIYAICGLFLVGVIGATFLLDGGGDPSAALEFNDDATRSSRRVRSRSTARSWPAA